MAQLTSLRNRVLFVFLLAFLLPFQLFSGQTGKIKGTITDAARKEPLPFVNVLLQGTTLGAASDMEGNYVILNIPPGVYTVVVTFVGYQKVEIREVRVSVDFTTPLDIKMTEGSIELPAVIVQGERNPLIRKDLTSPIAAISSEQLRELPVDNVTDVIKLQAGVVVDNSGGLHIRGGRSNEIAYTVNGISVNNPLNNTQGVGLATNALQEISVSTGTFSAEYGDALSGVINYVTKEGGEKYNGSVRFYSGDQVSSRKDIFFNINKIDPFNHYRAEGTLGGPLPFVPRTSFFASGVYERNQGYQYGIRIFRPTDSYLARNEFPSTDPRYIASGDTLPYIFNPFSRNSNGAPTGDGAIVPMDTREGINLTAKVSFRPVTSLKIDYDFLYGKNQSRGFSQSYRFNPDGRATFNNTNTSHSINVTHTLSSRAFYSLKVALNSSEAKNYARDNLYDADYVPGFFSRTLSNTFFLTGGTSLDRTLSNTRTLAVKLDAVAQLFDDHEFKVGGDLRIHKIDIESYVLQFDKVLSAQLLADSTRSLTSIIPTPEVAPDNLSYAKFSRKPVQASLYLLDKIELFRSMILNIGVRYEYFDPAAEYISDLSTALTDQGVELKLNYNNQQASIKHRVAPRISVSYPITDQGVIRFSYGHFYQYPTYSDPGGNLRLSTIYRNPEFNAPSSTNPFFGNADLRPQRSIQYEIGLQQGLSSDLKLELTGFYKDVNDYIEVQTIRTGLGDRIYTVLGNLNFANVKGVTVSLFKRRTVDGLFGATLDYTFTVATGNRTDADAFFFDEKSGKQSEKLFVPLSFDRSHVLNGTLSFSKPENWTASLIGSFQTGTPYTPALPTDLAPVKFDQNSDRRPVNWNVDLHLEKFFTIAEYRLSVFLRVDNLFDTQNEIFIYENSGHSLYSLDEVRSGQVFQALRSRIKRGDFGDVADSRSLGARLDDALNKYYQRSDWLGAPREVRFGFSLLF